MNDSQRLTLPQIQDLLTRLRNCLRMRHYSIRTEETYVYWIKELLKFHFNRNPEVMQEPDISRFLTHLAVSKKVSASTQNQALSAILFLHRQVLDRNLDWINGI